MNRSTAFFILVTLALAAYIYLVDSKEQGTKEKEASEKKLFDITAAKIDKLTIVNEEMTIDLVKKGSEWNIVKPISYPADLSTVEQIISELEFVETRRTIPSSEIQDLEPTLQQWSLVTPVTKLIASGENKKHELLIGRKIAVNDLYYAKKSNDIHAPVELISSFSRNNFDKKLNDLRSKDVLKFTSTDVRKISLRESKTAASLGEEREVILENSLWSIRKPIKARADREQINSWISNALGLKAVRFLSDDSSNLNVYGLSSPLHQIVFGFDSKPEQTLLIGSITTDQPTEVYAKRLQSNTVFTLNQEAIQKLLTSVSEWRDKHVMPRLLIHEVSSLKLEYKGKPLLFQKENGQWTMAGTQPFSADFDKIAALFTSIQDLKSVQFVKDTRSDLKTYGLDKPAARVSFEAKKGEESFKYELIIGRTDKNITYVMNGSEPFIYSVASPFGADWPKESWQWRSLLVAGLQKDSIQKITTSDRKGLRYTIHRDDKKKWIKEGSPDFTLNEPAVDSLLNTLSTLRGVRWVAATAASTHEIQQPHLKIEVTTPEGSKSLKIGNTLPTGGRVAQWSGVETVFEITQPDFETINQNLINNPTPSIPTPAVPSTPSSPQH